MSGGQYVGNPFWPPAVKPSKGPLIHVPIPTTVVLDSGQTVQVKETSPGVLTVVKPSQPLPTVASHPSLAWLHTFGKFMLDNVAPLAESIALQLLLKKI
jgi:hypothetical protein